MVKMTKREHYAFEIYKIHLLTASTIYAADPHNRKYEEAYNKELEMLFSPKTLQLADAFIEMFTEGDRIVMDACDILGDFDDQEEVLIAAARFSLMNCEEIGPDDYDYEIVQQVIATRKE